MNDQIIKVIIGILPDVLSWIKQQFAANGTLPTKEELQTHLEADLDKYIAIGNKWLEDHKND